MLVQLAKQLPSLRGDRQRRPGPRPASGRCAIGGDATASTSTRASRSAEDIAARPGSSSCSRLLRGQHRDPRRDRPLFGRIVAIDDHHPDLFPLKSKSIAWHREFVFTHSMRQPRRTWRPGTPARPGRRTARRGAPALHLGTEIADFSAARLAGPTNSSRPERGGRQVVGRRWVGGGGGDRLGDLDGALPPLPWRSAPRRASRRSPRPGASGRRGSAPAMSRTPMSR